MCAYPRTANRLAAGSLQKPQRDQDGLPADRRPIAFEYLATMQRRFSGSSAGQMNQSHRLGGRCPAGTGDAGD